MSSGCYYVSYAGVAFGYTQVLPLLVGLMLSMLSLVTRQMTYVMFGLYLYGSQYILWAFQANFRVDRPNPVCQEYHTYAMPSIQLYYAAALLTFVIACSLYRRSVLSVFSWVFLYLLGILPAALLWWVSYNTWWEILLSMGLGVMATLLFCTVAVLFIVPSMDVIRNMDIITWFGYTDNYFTDYWAHKRALILRDDLDEITRIVNAATAMG